MLATATLLKMDERFPKQDEPCLPCGMYPLPGVPPGHGGQTSARLSSPGLLSSPGGDGRDGDIIFHWPEKATGVRGQASLIRL